VSNVGLAVLAHLQNNWHSKFHTAFLAMLKNILESIK